MQHSNSEPAQLRVCGDMLGWNALPKLLKLSAFFAAKPQAPQLMPIFMSACTLFIR